MAGGMTLGGNVWMRQAASVGPRVLCAFQKDSENDGLLLDWRMSTEARLEYTGKVYSSWSGMVRS